MNGIRPGLGLVVLAVLLSAFVPRAAMAAGTLYVDDTGTTDPARSARCARPNYDHIQAAVDAAVSGTKIVVCEGTYIEQVTVAGKSLKLEGRSGAVVQAPNTLVAPGAIVHFTGAQRSSIKGLTIQTDDGDASGTLRAGIQVSGGADVSVSRNQLFDIRSATADPVFQCGSAILVGTQSMAAQDGLCGAAVPPSPPSAGVYARADISDNRVERYGNVGVEANGADAVAMIDDNRIIGLSSPDTDEQFGIQVANGAQVDAEDNVITGNQSSQDPEDIDAAGVFVYRAGAVDSSADDEVRGVSIRDNRIEGNTEGIFGRDADGAVFRSNDISASGRSGIILVITDAALVVENKANDNGFDGIRLVGGSGNTLRDNRANRNVNGIQLDEEPSGNLIHSNTTNNNSGNGILVGGGSLGNTIDDNEALNNGEFDVSDGNGDLSSNTWNDNECETDNPEGLCDD